MQKCFDTLEVNASNVVVKASCMNQVTSNSENMTEEDKCIQTINDFCPGVKGLKGVELALKKLKPIDTLKTGTDTEEMNTLKELVKTYSFFYKIKPHYKNFCLEEMKVRLYIDYRVEDIKKWIARTREAIKKVGCNPTVSSSIPEPESEEKLSNPIAITATQQASGSTPAADYPTGAIETLKADVLTGIQEVETLLETLQTAEQTDEQTAADKELTDKIESVVDSLGCIDNLDADISDDEDYDGVSYRSKNFPDSMNGGETSRMILKKRSKDEIFLKLSKVDDSVEDVLSSLFDQTSCAEEEEDQVKGDFCSLCLAKRADRDVFREYMELKDKCMELDTGKNPIDALTGVPTDKDNSNKTEENMEEIFKEIKSRLNVWYKKTNEAFERSQSMSSIS